MNMKDLVEFIIKNLIRSWGFLGGLTAYWLAPAISIVGAGFVWAIIDMYLFIKKKPLVYKKEYKHFLASKEVQEEMEREYNHVILSTIHDGEIRNQAAVNLKKLKEMQEEGLITEEEFEEKKKELLAKF